MNKVLPIKFRYKLEKISLQYRFLDNLGIDYLDCIRYTYFKDERTIYHYSLGCPSEVSIIQEEVPDDLTIIEKIIYEDHQRRNAPKV